MKIKAKGQLRHHFWGDYSAQITLVFNDSEDCELALPLLAKTTGKPGEFRNACGGISDSIGWLQGKEGHENACGAILASDPLERVIAFLKEHGASDQIDSCATSIDHGEPFEITLEVEDPKQLQIHYSQH